MSHSGKPKETSKVLEQFLSAFFAEDEPIYLRSFKPKGAPDTTTNRPRKLTITRAALKGDESLICKLKRLNEESGLYFVVNSGGHKKSEIERITSFFVESDNLTKNDQHRILDAAPLATSIRVETARSVHAYWLLQDSCGVTDWEQLQRQLIRYFTSRDLRADGTIKDASRVMRLPGFDHLSYTESGEYERVHVKAVQFNPVRRYSVAQITHAFIHSANSEFESGIISRELPEKILDGEGRHREMVSLAGTLRDRGLSADEMLPTLRTVNASRFMPPLPDDQLEQIANSVTDLYEPSKPIGGPPKPEPLTDFGNASRLVRVYGDVLRYDRERRLWAVWTGQKWAVESSDVLAMQLAFKVPDVIIQEAAATNDESIKKELLKHAIRSQSARSLEAIVRIVRNRNEIAANIEEFDPHSHLLNVQNGTIDLCTRKLQDHRREDLITKIVPIIYDERAKAPLFESFLFRIFGGNQSLISFMQRVCGYTLTGDTGEQCMFLLHGDGANGKSTLIEIIAAVTGEYSAHIRTEALVKHKNTSAGSHSEDIAELRGARFVSAVETNVGQQLAEGLLKQVTGQDRVKARRLYSHNIEFRPSFKLWLAANHKPEIAGMDHAIWRRIHLLPFEVTIPEHEREKRILDKLKAELPGILAWCVRGASEWHRQGLNPPDEVRRATERYKAEEDTLSAFIADVCVVGGEHFATVSEMYGLYEMWCRTNGEPITGRKVFTGMMRARGFKYVQADRGRVWRGIGRRPFGSMAAN
jgi:putative DNA primase/helicase